MAHAPRAGSRGTATANYYEILGVDPRASHDEVKRGFLDLALRFQRERAEARSPATVERAEFRQHEIEQAWSVLRNPAARARYDDELRAARGGPAPVEREPVRLLPPIDDLPVLEVLDLEADGGRRARGSKRRRRFGSSSRWAPPSPS